MRRRLAFVFGLGFLLAFGCERAGAQSQAVVLIRPELRALLAEAWDAQRVGDPERMYCLLYATDTTRNREAVVYHVFAALPAAVDSANAISAHGSCPRKVDAPGVRVTVLHTHPAFTCSDALAAATCLPGGVWAWDCAHSDTDSATYRKFRQPMALLQCDRNAFVPYFAPSRSLAPAAPAASRLTASRYALLAGGVLAYNAACPLGRAWCERDPGGYVDQWRSPDKFGHALGAAAVTSLAMQSGVSPWRAFAVTNVAGLGLELTQAIGGGHVSGRDLVWNAAGALVPVLWRKVWR